MLWGLTSPSFHEMKTTYPHETNMAGGWKLALWLIFKTPGDPVKKLRYVAEKKTHHWSLRGVNLYYQLVRLSHRNFILDILR